jgi:hypothetical protein
MLDHLGYHRVSAMACLREGLGAAVASTGRDDGDAISRSVSLTQSLFFFGQVFLLCSNRQS